MKTINVNPLSTIQTLKNAINQAKPGDQILLEPGHYKEFVVIDKPITIIGNGNREEIIFQGSMKITSNITLENITFDGNFTKVTLHALHILDGETVVKNCHFTQLNYFGILLEQEASLQVNHTTFTKVNTGIQAIKGATLFLEDSTFSMNQSKGIVISKNAKGTIQRCQFENIEQAAFYLSEGSETIIQDCTIYSGNFSAIKVKKAKAILMNCEISKNNGTQVSIEESDVKIKNCTIHSGGEKANGISMVRSKVEIENSKIHHHWEPQIYAKQSTLSVIDSKIFDSPAVDSESAIGINLLDDSHGTIQNCEIFNHFFIQVLAENRSFLTIKNSKIYGGKEACRGLCFAEDSKGVVEHCEIYQTWEQLYILGSSEVIVNDTHIYHPLSEAMGCYVFNSKLIMNHCEIEGHTSKQIDAEGSIIELKGSKIHDGEFSAIRLLRSQSTIEDCDIYQNNKFPLIVVGDGNILLNRCNIYSSHNVGIEFDGAKGVIKDCIIYENGYRQIEVYGESEVKIMNTTIDKGPEETIGLVVTEASTVEIANCIFSNHDSPQILVEKNSKFCLKDSNIMNGRGANSCGIRIIDASGSIEQCEFNNNGEYHIVIEQNSEVTVKDCQMDSRKEDGILIQDSKGIITNCDFLQ